MHSICATCKTAVILFVHNFGHAHCATCSLITTTTNCNLRGTIPATLNSCLWTCASQKSLLF